MQSKFPSWPKKLSADRDDILIFFSLHNHQLPRKCSTFYDIRYEVDDFFSFSFQLFDRMHSPCSVSFEENSSKWGREKIHETWSWSKFIAFTLWISFNDYSSGRIQFFSFSWQKRIQHFKFSTRNVIFCLDWNFLLPASATQVSLFLHILLFFGRIHIHRRHFHRYQLMVSNEYYNFREHWTCTTYTASTLHTPHSTPMLNATQFH